MEVDRDVVKRLVVADRMQWDSCVLTIVLALLEYVDTGLYLLFLPVADRAVGLHPMLLVQETLPTKL